MKRTSGKIWLVMILAFVVFGLGLMGCASSGKTISAGGSLQNGAALYIGPFYVNNMISTYRWTMSSFDGKAVDWKSKDLVTIAPGEHTFTAEMRVRKNVQPLSGTFTVSAGGYYTLELYSKLMGIGKPVTLEKVLKYDLTKSVTHGANPFFDIFCEAEQKAGIKTLANGVGRLRAPTKKGAANNGVYDLSVPPLNLVTLQISGALRVRQFDGKAVSWGGGPVRIPPGQHTFVIDYTYVYTPRATSGLMGLIDVIADAAKPRDTEGIKLVYEFYPQAIYDLYEKKDKSVEGRVAAVVVKPKKGAPKGQEPGEGSVLVDLNSVINPAAAQSSGIYNIAAGGTPTGSYTVDDLRQMARIGELTKDTFVWKEGMPQWAAAGTIDELSGIWSSVPPPLPLPPK